MIRVLSTILCVLLTASTAIAEVRTEVVPYTDAGLTLEGYLAWDDAVQGTRPGVLVVHEWWGLNDYVRKRARQLAAMGYVAFALDMYGKGKVTEHPDQAGAWMKVVQANVPAWRTRAMAGLKVLRAQNLADPARLAAIGYCFGGATVLQLAYAGAPLRGVVSFHGALPLPPGTMSRTPKTKVLIAHGNADPFLSEQHIRTFRKKMEASQWDWQMIVYAGARHAFTNPGADAHGMDALKYNEAADRRSWKHMQVFFEEIFSP